jgi:hypothetical protein
VARTIGRVPYGVPSLWYNIGMEQAHTFSLTKKQEEKLANLMCLLYDRASRSPAVPAPMLLLIGGVRRAVLDTEGLDQPQINVILWAMELVFAQFDEDDMDIQLEMCYHKLTGYWYEGFDPWYQRIDRYDKDGVYQGVRQDGR